jgi:hypothetical protein
MASAGVMISQTPIPLPSLSVLQFLTFTPMLTLPLRQLIPPPPIVPHVKMASKSGTAKVPVALPKGEAVGSSPVSQEVSLHNAIGAR